MEIGCIEFDGLEADVTPPLELSFPNLPVNASILEKSLCGHQHDRRCFSRWARVLGNQAVLGVTAWALIVFLTLLGVLGMSLTHFCLVFIWSVLLFCLESIW